MGVKFTNRCHPPIYVNTRYYAAKSDRNNALSSFKVFNYHQLIKPECLTVTFI